VKAPDAAHSGYSDALAAKSLLLSIGHPPNIAIKCGAE
jgi:hypothetical protein